MFKLSVFTIILSVYTSVAFVPSSTTHGCGVSLKRVFAPVSTKLLAYADRSHNFYDKNEPAKGGILYFLTQVSFVTCFFAVDAEMEWIALLWNFCFLDFTDELVFFSFDTESASVLYALFTTIS